MRWLPRSTTPTLAALVCLTFGCSERYDTSRPGPAAPHGGTLISLPEDKGLIEVVHKPAVAKDANVTREVAFYVLKADGTPYSPAPTSGLLKGGKKSVNLTAEDGGLVTPQGPPIFPGSEPEGTLTLELEGKSMTVPLGVR